MSYKNVSALILEARAAAEELDNTDTTGIPDVDILRMLNQGQNIIYRKIISKSQKLFTKSKVVPLNGGEKEISMPKDIYAQNRLADVKYVRQDIIYQVHSASEKEDLYRQNGCPYKYYRKANKITLIPANRDPGELRLLYIHKIPELQFKAASIGSVSILTNSIDSLEFNIATDTINSDAFLASNYFTVVNKQGKVKASNIPFDVLDSGTGVVTVTPGFTLDLDESINVGDLVIPGPLASTHSGLELDVEEYIVDYAVMKMLQRQGSAEIGTQAQILLKLEDDIMAVYSHIEDDIREIPMVSSSSDEGWG